MTAFSVSLGFRLELQSATCIYLLQLSFSTQRFLLTVTLDQAASSYSVSPRVAAGGRLGHPQALWLNQWGLN